MASKTIMLWQSRAIRSHTLIFISMKSYSGWVVARAGVYWCTKVRQRGFDGDGSKTRKLNAVTHLNRWYIFILVLWQNWPKYIFIFLFFYFSLMILLLGFFFWLLFADFTHAPYNCWPNNYEFTVLGLTVDRAILYIFLHNYQVMFKF